jgi:hypothetical protein
MRIRDSILGLLQYITSNKRYEQVNNPKVNLEDSLIDKCLSEYQQDKKTQDKYPDGEWVDLSKVGFINSILPSLPFKKIFKQKIDEWFNSVSTLDATKKDKLIEYIELMNRINKSYKIIDWIHNYDIISTDGNARYVYDAYQINLLIKDIAFPNVLEIGGGFGGLAYHLLKINGDVRYIDVDLPEMLILPKVYLLSNFKDRDIKFIQNSNISSIPDKSIDVVVNCHSLSEMNKKTIDWYCYHIQRICKGYFYSVNNRTHFDAGNHIEISYTNFPLSNMKLLHECRSMFSDLVDKRHFECLYKVNDER